MLFVESDREVLLLFLFFCAGMYVNRKHLGKLEHQVFGYYLPEWAISVLISCVLAVFVWVMVHIIAWIVTG